MRSNDTSLTRRGLLAATLALAAAPLVPRVALALTTNEAKALIQKVVDDTLKVVNSENSDARAIAAFEQIFVRYGDVPVIARAVLGQPWRSASPSQQKAFVDAFQGYLARKYGAEFREYRGSSMQVNKAVDQGQKGIVVNTTIQVPGSAPVSVDWQVSDRSGAPKMFNMFIEGVSMLSTERSEVRAILEANRNNIDALIADLKRRG